MATPKFASTCTNDDVVYDVVIIGAGVVGSVMATSLARQGRRVLLIERSLREPDRIVGELLQPGGVAALRALGLEGCLDGIDALPVKGYKLFYFQEEIAFEYPSVAKYPIWQDFASLASKKTEADNDEHKRHEGRSFHHGRFVMKLREAAGRERTVTVVEASATRLLWSKDENRVIGVQTEVVSGEEARATRCYFAHLTIVADGQASNLRSELCCRKPLTKSRFWGLELKDCELGSYGGFSLAVIGSGIPTGIYQIGSREARILMDIPTEVSAEQSKCGGNMRDFIRTNAAPSLPKQLRVAVEKTLDEGDRLRSMPNSWLPPSFVQNDGVMMLGDAFNMRHPLSGSGMTVALNDAVILSQLLHPSHVPSLSHITAVTQQMARFRRQRKQYNLPLNTLAQVMYPLVVAQDYYWRIFQRGFVEYARSTKSRKEELAALMSGVLPNPIRLYYHLGAVAIFSARLHLFERLASSSPSVGIFMTLFQCLVAFVKVACVVAPYVLYEVWA